LTSAYAKFNDYFRLNFDNQSLPDHILPNEKNFAIVVGSMFAVSFLFDQSIRNYVQKEFYGGSNLFTEFLYKVGDRNYVFYGTMALYSANVILQNSYYNETLMLSLMSLAVTQGITEAFKQSFRRTRPRHSPDNAFDFGISGDSFFSGHSSGAWAYFTVFAGRFPQIRWVAYGLAACVSLSRIYEDAHWTSDILLGALVGYCVGRFMLRTSVRYADRINIIPYVDMGKKYVLVQYRF